MGWLRLVGSLKLQVSFAKEPCKRDYILQKRPMILRSVLMVATPYEIACMPSVWTRFQSGLCVHMHRVPKKLGFRNSGIRIVYVYVCIFVHIFVYVYLCAYMHTQQKHRHRHTHANTYMHTQKPVVPTVGKHSTQSSIFCVRASEVQSDAPETDF